MGLHAIVRAYGVLGAANVGGFWCGRVSFALGVFHQYNEVEKNKKRRTGPSDLQVLSTLPGPVPRATLGVCNNLLRVPRSTYHDTQLLCDASGSSFGTVLTVSTSAFNGINWNCLLSIDEHVHGIG